MQRRIGAGANIRGSDRDHAKRVLLTEGRLGRLGVYRAEAQPCSLGRMHKCTLHTVHCRHQANWTAPCAATMFKGVCCAVSNGCSMDDDLRVTDNRLLAARDKRSVPRSLAPPSLAQAAIIVHRKTMGCGRVDRRFLTRP